MCPANIRRVGSSRVLTSYGRGLAVVAEESARRGKVHDKMVRVVFGLVGAEDSAGRYRVGDERGKGLARLTRPSRLGGAKMRNPSPGNTRVAMRLRSRGPFRFGGTVLKEAAGVVGDDERSYGGYFGVCFRIDSP